MTLVFGHLPGVSKKDALEFVLAQSGKFVGEYGPAVAGLDLLSWRGGYLFQISAGGSRRSYLKDIARQLDESEIGTRVIMDTAERQVEMFIKPDSTQRFVFRVLPESSDLDATPVEEGKKLSPIMPTHQSAVVTGSALFMAGAVALGLASFLVSMSDHFHQQVESARANQAVSDLPVWHTPSRVGLQPGEYIKDVRFENGHWLKPTVACAGDQCKDRSKTETAKGVRHAKP